ncbi:hypothetical protein C8Q69DRAFT_444827 [Paecilomyces variotii]|uniref:Uncharacterized protein n=1 Tax=Byssochlamys spectabilis TaxID=264951 RepID=A0A443HSS4_BYSSP|nr:hypothetical protein C8Q69DRAFT_444827 [Paecilomyces variotii]RWQ94871.1 hypothetical protein C8Q69DRAFT_444827 [Paecilomyces variotii]
MASLRPAGADTLLVAPLLAAGGLPQWTWIKDDGQVGQPTEGARSSSRRARAGADGQATAFPYTVITNEVSIYLYYYHLNAPGRLTASTPAPPLLYGTPQKANFI